MFLVCVATADYLSIYQSSYLVLSCAYVPSNMQDHYILLLKYHFVMTLNLTKPLSLVSENVVLLCSVLFCLVSFC
jgi:hypothetical protein